MVKVGHKAVATVVRMGRDNECHGYLRGGKSEYLWTARMRSTALKGKSASTVKLLLKNEDAYISWDPFLLDERASEIFVD